MRLKPRVVTVQVFERGNEPATKRTYTMAGSTQSLTVRETTAEEVWKLVEEAIRSTLEDSANE